MKNILSNIKFGDLFMTVNNHKAIIDSCTEFRLNRTIIYCKIEMPGEKGTGGLYYEKIQSITAKYDVDGNCLEIVSLGCKNLNPKDFDISHKIEHNIDQSIIQNLTQNYENEISKLKAYIKMLTINNDDKSIHQSSSKNILTTLGLD